MWQRFTERARRVILLAREEANTMSVGHIGTEHLLLGLLREGEGVAPQVLSKIGVDFASVRAKVQAEAEYPGDAPVPEPKLAPKAKRVLELAADEARRMRHNYIGTEHLLLGLLREKDGLASKILREMGLQLEDVREQVLNYLGPDAPQAPPTAPPDAEKWEQPSDKTIVRVLGTLLEGDSMALKILVASGLDAEAARERVQKFLRGDAEP